ncbi:MAG: type VI secretion system-associated FHA domain protein TagH [Pseudomonadota bacterium]
MSEQPSNEAVESVEVTQQELFEAFLKGAGIADQAQEMANRSKLTPELMEMLGKLLSVSIHGTHSLLQNRSLVKREVNADATMIVMRNNNPLKFLQKADAVVLQMLRKRMPGFMAPVEAMQEAYRDLQAHHSAMLVGFHSAQEDGIERFDPAKIEHQLGEANLTEKLFPSTRKAKMWAQLVEIYQGIKKERASQNKTFFGNVFLNAYEAEIARCEKEANRK